MRSLEFIPTRSYCYRLRHLIGQNVLKRGFLHLSLYTPHPVLVGLIFLLYTVTSNIIIVNYALAYIPGHTAPHQDPYNPSTFWQFLQVGDVQLFDFFNFFSTFAN